MMLRRHRPAGWIGTYPTVYSGTSALLHREMDTLSDPKMHDPEAKKSMDARLARIEGQVRAVRRMIGDDRSCESIAQQLSAARRALDRAFYEMVSCMIRHESASGTQARSERAGQVADLLARFG